MKFVHIADMHFDAPFTSLNSKENLGDKRRLEQRNVFKKIIDFIKENPQAKKELEVIFANYSAHFHNYGAYMIEAIRRFSVSQEFDEEQY